MKKPTKPMPPGVKKTELVPVGTASSLPTTPPAPGAIQGMPPQKRMVVFATPCLTGTVTIGYHLSIIEAGNELSRHGFDYAHILRPGDPYLSKVRSKMSTDFLLDYPHAEALFFIDDDVKFPAHKVIEFMQRPEPVLAGLYPMKDDAINFPAHLACNPVTGEVIERDGLVRALMVPTGFLRIRRQVLEIFARDVPKFVDAEAGGGQKAYSHIFQMGMEPDGGFIGEDCKWSKMWVDAGGEIWVDPNIEFGHRGTKTWVATFSDHLPKYRQKGIDEAKARAAKATLETAPVVQAPAVAPVKTGMVPKELVSARTKGVKNRHRGNGARHAGR